MTNAIHRPHWVPESGHRLRVIGVHFDAVRIEDGRGQSVARGLVDAAGGDAGPIVYEMTGGRWVYFLLRPGSVHRHDWPLGVHRFGVTKFRTVTFVGVPALEGNTWPLRWWSRPTRETPYVAPELLLDAIVDVQNAQDPSATASPAPGRTR